MSCSLCPRILSSLIKLVSIKRDLKHSFLLGYHTMAQHKDSVFKHLQNVPLETLQLQWGLDGEGNGAELGSARLLCSPWEPGQPLVGPHTHLTA